VQPEVEAAPLTNFDQWKKEIITGLVVGLEETIYNSEKEKEIMGN